jgi:hypothetical protein
MPNSSQLISFLLSFQTIMNPTRSVGQANFFSCSSQSIGSIGLSIVNKLTSRSITENGLRIHVHQHVGFKLHLAWHVFDKYNNKSVRCFERIFPELNDLYDFCKHLNGAFTGLCDCVCSPFDQWMAGKFNPYFLQHSTKEQLRQFVFLPSQVQDPHSLL